MHLKYHQIIATILVFFSFVMAAVVSRTVFERLPHLEDEVAYVYQARIFARGDVVIESPEDRRAFWQPFVIDYSETGNRFGKYSPGWSLLLSAGVNLGQMWVINAFFAALTVALVYRLGREVFAPDVGVVAAALTAFSPMALLLNSTLMSHTSALFAFTLFMYAYWRIEQRRRPLRWGLLAGLALGLLVMNRPLTAVGVTAPFILWSGLKVLGTAVDDWQARKAVPPVRPRFIPTLAPFVLLSVITILMSLFIPFYNYSATGDPGKNLYLEVWSYDRVGFGTCCGRSSQNGGEGHTIIKGIRHTRFDLSLTAADLFGWQIEPVTEELQEHLRTEGDWWPSLGLSFFLLPLGLLLGFRKWALRLWVIIGLIWLVVPLYLDMDFLKNDAEQIWRWLSFGAVWMLMPPVALILFDRQDVRSRWTWLLLGVIVGLIGLQLAYWIGSQRYSTRYYFETLTAFALISALPIAWLMRRINRPLVYAVFTLILVWSLYTYSTPRIEALYQFNNISQDLIDEIEARREGDQDILVLITGEQGSVRWRSYGTLMAVTSPYLDSDIVAAWNYSPSSDLHERLRERFADRQIIEMEASGNEVWFAEGAEGECLPGAGLAGIEGCERIEGLPQS